MMHAEYKQLRWLYSDWVDGIRLADPDPSVVKRAAPLRWLEDQTRQLGKQFVWRSGASMTKAVNQRKVIVYGILRYLENPGGTSFVMLSQIKQATVLLPVCSMVLCLPFGDYPL